MNIIALTTLCLILFSGLSAASSREPLILRYLEVSGTKAALIEAEETLFEYMKREVELTQKMLFEESGIEIGEKTRAVQESYIRRLAELTADLYSWSKLKDDLVLMYAEAFTDEEILGLIQFYESYVGQKYLEQENYLEKRMFDLRERAQLELKPKIQGYMEDMKKDLRIAIEKDSKAAK